MKGRICSGLLIVFCILARPSAGAADPETKPADAIKEDLSKGTHGKDVTEETKKAAAEYMMATMMPGPEHERLAKRAGAWNVTTNYWMQPGTPPMSFTHTSTSEMTMGGRFLEIRSKGQVMGQPFESLTIVGFDRRTDQYTIVGFDTMGTYYVEGAGTFDEATGSIIMPGETHDPKLNATERYRFVLRSESDDKYITEIIFKTPEDKDFMVVQSVSERIK